ncbi:MAG: hypothetical protein U0271_01105 [Polyangiaceae bacterium]
MSDAYRALRNGVALEESPACEVFRVEGAGAFSFVDRLVTTDLYLQEAQVREGLMLDVDGLVVADVLVGRREDSYDLFVETTAGVVAADLLRVGDASDVTVRSLAASHRTIGLHGPFAWELLGEWLGPDLVGMPYLSSFTVGDLLVVRAGKTGEFGYNVVVPNESAAASLEALVDKGRAFDLTPVDRATLDLAALENGFFCARGVGAFERDPLTLQLRWRLSNDKDYVGREALDVRAANRRRERITWLATDAPIAAGDAIEAFGEDVGRVLAALSSPAIGRSLAVARIMPPWAWSGLSCLTVRRTTGELLGGFPARRRPRCSRIAAST